MSPCARRSYGEQWCGEGKNRPACPGPGAARFSAGDLVLLAFVAFLFFLGLFMIYRGVSILAGCRFLDTARAFFHQAKGLKTEIAQNGGEEAKQQPRAPEKSADRATLERAKEPAVQRPSATPKAAESAGLGTGLGYALCNLPPVFLASPRQNS